MSDIKTDWYHVKKSYKGGSKEFQVRAPLLTPQEWECLAEWLGENTDGGRCYGYQLEKKDDKLPVMRYPADICEATMTISEKVVTETYWV